MNRSFEFAALAAGTVLVLAAGAFAEGLPNAVTEARRGVVTICAPHGGFGEGLPNAFFQEEPAGAGVVGSGIVLSRDGLILTANHTIAGNDDLTVILSDASEFKARVVASEPVFDVAILRIQDGDLSPIEWQSGPAEVGETVYALGTPAVFSESPGLSVNRGMVSAVHRTLEGVGAANWSPYSVDFLETDVQVAPGESGGALVDAEGRLVGMCVAVYFPSGGKARTFARPTDAWLKEGLGELLKSGRMPIGYLGLEVQRLSLEKTERLGIGKMTGLEVADVADGGPCDKAGVKSGDIVLQCDGQPVALLSELRRAELRLSPGANVKLTVYRPSARQTLDIAAVAGEAARTARPVDFRWRGMTVRDLSAGMRRDAGDAGLRGVVVSDVVQGGSAFDAGLRGGSVITEINDRPVRSLLEFVQMVKEIRRSEVVRIRTTEGIGHIKGESGG